MKTKQFVLFSYLFCFGLTFYASAAGSDLGSIKGTITTTDNKPAEGVTILIKNSIRIAVTDNRGVFEVKNMLPGNYTIVVSLLGYSDTEKEVLVESGKTTVVEFRLSLLNHQLNEAVVAGNKNSFKTNRLSETMRVKSSILELPQNVQVITPKHLYDQQILDMQDGVIRNISGATIVEQDNNIALISMRGRKVGAFRNGMNLSSAFGPLTEDMSMVERVEFAKGPASFMFGNGDAGGFYNVVTKKPSGRNRGEVSLSMGSFNFIRGTVDLDGKLSKNGKLLFRLNMMGQSKGSHRPYDFNNRLSIVPVLKYLVNEKTSVTLEYTHQYSAMNVIGSNNSFSRIGYADLPRNHTIAEPNLPKTKMKDRNLLLMFDHKISDSWKFTAQASYINQTQQGAALWHSGFDIVFNDSLIRRNLSIRDMLGKTKIGQMFLSGEVITGKIVHKILGGIDISSKENLLDTRQIAQLGGYFNIYKPVYDLATAHVFDRSKKMEERGERYFNSSQGYYLQDELAFFENKLRLTLAGRYTSIKTINRVFGDYKTSKFTPRIGLNFSVNNNTSVYFLNDQTFFENFGSDWQGKSFNPISETNLEFGIKRDWLNGRWNSTLSLYQITRNNVTVTDFDHPNPPFGFFLRPSGQYKTLGLEFDIKGQIAPGFNVMLNYAFTDSKVNRDSRPENVGKKLPGLSRHVQNTWINYRTDYGKLTGFGLSLGYQFQAKRLPFNTDYRTSKSLPNYFKLDGGITYERKKMGFNLLVNNILNTYLYAGAPNYSQGFIFWQSEPGVNFRLSLNYKF